MRTGEKSTDRKTLLWLWLLILGGCLLVFHNYILGNETLVFGDVGSDTKNQYIMWYNSVVNHLREGTFSGWDFNNGFGVNVFIMNLTEPFAILVHFLGVLFGPEHISRIMIYVHILKMLLAGTASYYFLSVHPTSERAKLLASFLYAFNGYLMVWGQHYQMGSFLVWLPLLFMFIEKTLKNWKYFPGVAALSGIIILGGFYQGYMIMLGCGIYVCLRVLLYEDRSWKKKWSFFLLEAGSMVFGVLMGALNLLPSLTVITGTSSRLDFQTSLFQRILNSFSLWPREYYKSLMYRLFGNNLQGSGNGFVGYANYYEAINLFFSTLFIILLAQYVCTIHRQNKTVLQKAAQYIGVAAAVFCVGIPAGSLAFNGFAYGFSRQTFLLMPLFALLCARMLDQILEERKISWLGLTGAAGAILVIYTKAYRNMADVNYRTNALLLGLSGIAMVILLAVAVHRNTDARRYQNCCSLLVLVLFVNVISDTSLCYRYRDTLKKNDTEYYEGTYHSSVNRALAWLEAEDNTFYRVEKDFDNASGCMDGMAQNYRGVSTYNSAQNGNIVEFVSTLWPQILTGYDNNHYDFSNTVREYTMASLSGVKYLLSRSEKLDIPGYELYHQIDDISIYRNTGTDSIGKFFTKTVSSQEFEEVRKDTDTWDLLSSVLIVDEESGFDISQEELEEYRKQEIGDMVDWERADLTLVTRTKEGLETAEQMITLPLKTEQLSRYENASVEFVLATEAGTEIEIRMNGQSPCIRYQYGGENSYRLQVPVDTDTIEIRVVNPGIHTAVRDITFYGTESTYEFPETGQITIDAPGKDSLLTGTVEAGEDGMMMLAIPYQDGWSVYLNGEKQELARGDYGFIACEVKAGSYDLRVEYQVPLLRAGIMISAVAWLLWLAVTLQIFRMSGQNSRKRKEIEG